MTPEEEQKKAQQQMQELKAKQQTLEGQIDQVDIEPRRPRRRRANSPWTEVRISTACDEILDVFSRCPQRVGGRRCRAVLDGIYSE